MSRCIHGNRFMYLCGLDCVSKALPDSFDVQALSVLPSFLRQMLLQALQPVAILDAFAERCC